MKYSNSVKKIKFIPREKPIDPMEDIANNLQEKQDFVDFHRDIDILPANGVTYFSGTLKFTDLDLPAYVKSNLRFELDIGNIFRP